MHHAVPSGYLIIAGAVMGVGNNFAVDSIAREQGKYLDLLQMMKGVTMDNIPIE